MPAKTQAMIRRAINRLNELIKQYVGSYSPLVAIAGIVEAEAAARTAYTEACIEANIVLVRGTEIVCSIFGRTSPEYKQFIARASAAKEEEEIEAELVFGEE